MNQSLMDSSIELDRWLRFAGCRHLGYIATAMGPNDELIVYWEKHRSPPGGMPETYCGKPVKVKRMGEVVPTSS